MIPTSLPRTGCGVAWITVVSHWFTRLVVLGLFVLMLFHWAHRFKYTVIHGLQLARLETPISVLSYGGALLGSAAVLLIVWTI